MIAYLFNCMSGAEHAGKSGPTATGTISNHLQGRMFICQILICINNRHFHLCPRDQQAFVFKCAS